jgi:hypothetical protein
MPTTWTRVACSKLSSAQRVVAPDVTRSVNVPYVRVDAHALPVGVAAQAVTRDPEPLASVRIGPGLEIQVPTDRQVPALKVGVHDWFAPAPVRLIVDLPVPFV